MVFFKIAWIKRLESFVELMSKNSISGLTDNRTPTEYTEFLTKGRMQADLLLYTL
jgi:hypothetical protein